MPSRGDAPRVSGLYVYPVKSCQGVSLEKAVLTRFGLGWAGEEGLTTGPLDRQWCILELDDDAGSGQHPGKAGFVQDIRVQAALANVQTSFKYDTGNARPVAIEARTPLLPDLPSLALPI